ncbi:hypothetical protein L9F63_020752, partial [Diploptera punctata]
CRSLKFYFMLNQLFLIFMILLFTIYILSFGANLILFNISTNFIEFSMLLFLNCGLIFLPSLWTL